MVAHGPRPAVAGLDDELRVLEKENHRGRVEAYRRSRLSLTEFGKAVVAHGSREEMERDTEALHGIGLWATFEKDA